MEKAVGCSPRRAGLLQWAAFGAPQRGELGQVEEQQGRRGKPSRPVQGNLGFLRQSPAARPRRSSCESSPRPLALQRAALFTGWLFLAALSASQTLPLLWSICLYFYSEMGSFPCLKIAAAERTAATACACPAVPSSLLLETDWTLDAGRAGDDQASPNPPWGWERGVPLPLAWLKG